MATTTAAKRIASAPTSTRRPGPRSGTDAKLAMTAPARVPKPAPSSSCAREKKKPTLARSMGKSTHWQRSGLVLTTTSPKVVIELRNGTPVAFGTWIVKAIGSAEIGSAREMMAAEHHAALLLLPGERSASDTMSAVF